MKNRPVTVSIALSRNVHAAVRQAVGAKTAAPYAALSISEGAKPGSSLKRVNESVLVAESGELDDRFVAGFRQLRADRTRLLIVDTETSSDRTAERLVDLRIRTKQRFYIAKPPIRDVPRWLSRLLGRLAPRRSRSDRQRLIFDARLDGDRLVVINPEFRRMTVPISQIPALAQAGEESIRRFEVDPDGSFIHWRDLDVHLGWEQLEQIADPGAARKAQQQHRDFNVRYGAAIGRVRNTAGFGVDAIAGLSAKQLRRIERGECRLMPNAVKALANAHGVTDNAYLAMVAKEAARNPS